MGIDDRRERTARAFSWIDRAWDPLHPGFDPYWSWLLDEGRDDFLLPGAQSLPLLIRLGGPIPFSARSAATPPPAGRRKSGLPLLENLQAAVDAARTAGEASFVFMLPPDALKPLMTEPGYRPLLGQLPMITLGPPLPVSIAPPTTILRPARAPAKGAAKNLSKAKTAALKNTAKAGTSTEKAGRPADRRVIVGVIDDGLPFGHARFRDAAGTRVDRVWLQDGTHVPGSAVLYGRELDKATIDGWLADATHDGQVDEDQFYRLAGVADFTDIRHKTVAAHGSHGAHVMDTAAGWDHAAAPDCRVIAVQLPIATTEDSSGATLAPYAVDAVKFIRDRALELADGGPCPPIVINFSYGIVAGPHDGSNEIEAQIDAIVTAFNAVPGQTLRVVLPAGNSHIARAHAVIDFPAPKVARSVDFRILPDDRTPSFIEIWMPSPLPKAGQSRMRLRLTAPDGTTSTWLGESTANVIEYTFGGKVVCRISYHDVNLTKPGAMFLVALQPTARLEHTPTNKPVSPPGRWTLTFENQALAPDEQVHAWVQRDDTPYGYPVRGRQPYFEEHCPSGSAGASCRQACAVYDAVSGRPVESDDPACLLQHAGSINAIGTGKHPIVVGALLAHELRAARYSAGGPLRDSGAGVSRAGPDAVTISDDSSVHAGVIASGTRSGSAMLLNGTSVAAPRMARWIAGELAANRPGDRAAVQALAAAHEAALPFGAPPKQSDQRVGAGRIRLPHPHPGPRGMRRDPD